MRASAGAAAAERVFPGLNEVIPQSNAVNAGLTAAEAVIARANTLDEVHQKLAELADTLKEVEAQFTNWEDAINWPLNRLMTAETRYSQIDQEQKQQLEVLSGLFKNLEDLRTKWTEERTFWQDWHTALRKSEVKIPDEVFSKTQKNIDDLLERISEASTKLLKMQEEFSAEQEILASRLHPHRQNSRAVAAGDLPTQCLFAVQSRLLPSIDPRAVRRVPNKFHLDDQTS